MLRPKVRDFAMPLARPKRVGREMMVHYWHPRRPGAHNRTPDPLILAKIEELDENVEVSWAPLHERWLVWLRTPRMQNAITQGWNLLFVHEDEDKNYLPLDERVLARLYSASMKKWGDARKYFDHIEAEMEREAAMTKKANLADTIDQAMETFEHSQIKNINSGSNGHKYGHF